MSTKFFSTAIQNLAAASSAVLLAATGAAAQSTILNDWGQVEGIQGLKIDDGAGNPLVLDVRFVSFLDFVETVSEPSTNNAVGTFSQPATRFDLGFVFSEFFEAPRNPFFSADPVGAYNAADAISSFLGASLETPAPSVFGASDSFAIPTDDPFAFGTVSLVGDIESAPDRDEILRVEGLDSFLELPSDLSIATFSPSPSGEGRAAAAPEGPQTIGLLAAGLLAVGLKLKSRK